MEVVLEAVEDILEEEDSGGAGAAELAVAAACVDHNIRGRQLGPVVHVHTLVVEVHSCHKQQEAVGHLVWVDKMASAYLAVDEDHGSLALEEGLGEALEPNGILALLLVS